jgi:hypothetical protein
VSTDNRTNVNPWVGVLALLTLCLVGVAQVRTGTVPTVASDDEATETPDLTRMPDWIVTEAATLAHARVLVGTVVGAWPTSSGVNTPAIDGP